MGDLDALWPLFQLRLRCGPVELRPPDDADLVALAELAKEPIHDTRGGSAEPTNGLRPPSRASLPAWTSSASVMLRSLQR
jgi:hypothetical protein